MGKGSKQRPTAISQTELATRWALAFGKEGPMSGKKCKPKSGKPKK